LDFAQLRMNLFDSVSEAPVLRTNRLQSFHLRLVLRPVITWRHVPRAQALRWPGNKTGLARHGPVQSLLHDEVLANGGFGNYKHLPKRLQEEDPRFSAFSVHLPRIVNSFNGVHGEERILRNGVVAHRLSCNYSRRSASIGSIEAASRDGTTEARAADVIRTATAMASIAGSRESPLVH
jgi:hypothetical protein